MNIPFAREVIPLLIACLAIFGSAGLLFRWLGRRKTELCFYLLAVVSSLYMLWFFRDPARSLPDDPSMAFAGADGIVMGIKHMPETEFLESASVRISIFLSLIDVHINRAPVSGTITHLGYYPGKRHFTFREESSDHNQHSVILIEGEHTRCLVKQIVGPVARRVVYWLEPGQEVAAGERIGMMKFGSRLDMYFPESDVEVFVEEGDRVVAGVTPVARIVDLTPFYEE